MRVDTLGAIALALLAAGLLAGCGLPAVQAPTAARADGAGCLAPSQWYRLGGPALVAVAGAELLARAAAQDVVLLGEYHTSRDDHLWQLQTLAALHLLQPDMVIGFEAFPRQVQPVLDAWVAGELDSEQFLQQVAWEKI